MDDLTIDKLSSENKRLKELLSKIVDSIPENDEWWEPQCGQIGDTYDDGCARCDQPIGAEVEWLEEANKLLGKSE